MPMTPNTLMSYPVSSRNREEEHISLRCFPQNASAIVNANNVGSGATVTRLATAGLFQVDFEKPYPQFVGARIEVGHATLVFHARVVSIITDATTGACTGFTFQVYTSAVSATISDVPAALTSWFFIEAVLLKSRIRG